MLSRAFLFLISAPVVRAGRLVASAFVVIAGVALAWLLSSGASHAQNLPTRNVALATESAPMAPRQVEEPGKDSGAVSGGKAGQEPDPDAQAARAKADRADEDFRQSERDFAQQQADQQAAEEQAAQDQADQQAAEEQAEQEASDRANEEFRQDERDVAQEQAGQRAAEEQAEQAESDRANEELRQDERDVAQEQADQRAAEEQAEQAASDRANEESRQDERDYANAAPERTQVAAAERERARAEEERAEQEQRAQDPLGRSPEEILIQDKVAYTDDPDAQEYATRLGETVAEEERRRDDRSVPAVEAVPHPWETRDEALLDAEQGKQSDPISSDPAPLTRSDPVSDDEVAAALDDVEQNPQSYGPDELAAAEKKLRDAARDRALAAGFDAEEADAAAYAAGAGFANGVEGLPDIDALPGDSRDFGYVVCEEGGTGCAVDAPAGTPVPGRVDRADPQADPAAAVQDEETVVRRTGRVPLATDIGARTPDEIAAEATSITESTDDRNAPPTTEEQALGNLPIIGSVTGAVQGDVDRNAADADAQRAATNLLRAEKLLDGAGTPEERAVAEQLVADARAQVIAGDRDAEEQETEARSAALEAAIDVAGRGRPGQVGNQIEGVAGDLAGGLASAETGPAPENPGSADAVPAAPVPGADSVEAEPGSARGPPPAGEITDPDAAVRQQYNDAVTGLADVEQEMREQGYDDEQIARELHQRRRDIGVEHKDMTTPEYRDNVIHPRNIKKYGDQLGPTVEWLRAGRDHRGQPKVPKTWSEIIESAKRTSGKDLGLEGNT